MQLLSQACILGQKWVEQSRFWRYNGPWAVAGVDRHWQEEWLVWWALRDVHRPCQQLAVTRRADWADAAPAASEHPAGSTPPAGRHHLVTPPTPADWPAVLRCSPHLHSINTTDTELCYNLSLLTVFMLYPCYLSANAFMQQVGTSLSPN